MRNGSGIEPVADDEIVFRRIPVNADYYDPTSDRPIQWIAFKPNQNDRSGTSVWRAVHVDAERAALVGARPGKGYYVVELRVADLRRLGADVIATPAEGGEGHASIVQLSWDRYQGEAKRAVCELAEAIARQTCGRVHGPFRMKDPSLLESD